MKAFKAIYTNQNYVEGRNKGRARVVTVVAISIPQWEYKPIAVFVDDDNALRSDNIDCFTQCGGIE